jgi:hypothetical protein
MDDFKAERCSCCEADDFFEVAVSVPIANLLQEATCVSSVIP